MEGGSSSVSGALTIKGALLRGISRSQSLELSSYGSLNLINGARLGTVDSTTGKPLVSSLHFMQDPSWVTARMP